MGAILETTQHHFQKIVEKDLEGILATYAQSEDTLVFVEGPREVTIGYEAIARGWAGFTQAPMTLDSCHWAEIYQETIVGDCGWLVGIADLRVTINGIAKALRLRGSFILRLHAKHGWQICHEHFSLPHADPYGIGDWLPKSETEPAHD